MNVTSYNGYTWSALFKASTQQDTIQGPPTSASEQQRTSGPALVPQVVRGSQVMPVLFTVKGNTGTDNETALQTLLSRLDIDAGGPPKLLTGTTNLGTAVEADALALSWRPGAVNQIIVEFAIQGFGWRAQADSTIFTASPSANGTAANGNTGKRDVEPTITVYWTGATQRPTSTASIGWKHRLGTGLTLTNITDDTLRNQPYQIGPINHRALVTAGQALSSGNDFRVFCNGKELRRNLIGANTRYCFVWVILPEVQPLNSITLDLITNNPSAGTPPTLTGTTDPMIPAMDIGGFTAAVASGVGAASFNIAAGSMEDGQYFGGTMFIDNAAGTGAAGQVRALNLNTSTQINVDRAFSTNPAIGDTIVVIHSGLAGNGGVVSASAANSLTDSSQSVQFDTRYVGGTVEIVSGTGSGQRRTISGINNATKVLTVSSNWTTNPGVGAVYRIYKPNGQRIWDVRNGTSGQHATTPHNGLWYTNKTAAPPTVVSWDAPASWYRFTYYRNEDEYSQPRYVTRSVGAGDNDHYPIMDIQRARKGRRGTQREAGIADAIGMFSPFPIRAVSLAGAFRNAKKAGTGTPGTGMCEAQFLVQESGGELWSAFYTDNAVYSSTTEWVVQQDVSTYGSPNRLAIALVPNGGDEIPENDSNTAELQTYTTNSAWMVFVDPQSTITESIDWWASPPSAVGVFDLWLRFNNHGATPATPYDRLDLGGTDRRVFIAATTERLKVDCAKRRATIVDSPGNFIRDAQFAVSASEVTTDRDGNVYTRPSARWLPIPVNPGTSAEDIPYSDPSGAGWGSLGIIALGRFGYLT